MMIFLLLAALLNSSPGFASCKSAPALDPAASALESLSDNLDQESRISFLKEDYLASGMCDPIFNYPDPYELPLLFSAANFAIPDECSYRTGGELQLADWVRILNLNDEQTKTLGTLLQSCKARLNDENRNRFRLELFRILKSKYEATSPRIPGNSLILNLMASLKMVKLKPDGSADCENEFINPDALQKALTGYSNLLKTGKIKSTRYLTVVDYTKPSNSRRMYVIDLNTNRIVHQTWVAHGMGNGKAINGSDGYGSNPPTSNEPESKLSSPGFIKTLGTYTGMWGPSLKLTGLEPSNNNIEGRRIVMHDWGVGNLLPEDPGKFKDSLRNLGSVSPANPAQMHRVVGDLTNTYRANVIASTEGCLGISSSATRVRDGSGRTIRVESGSDYLREILADGSLIFSYTGPAQKSPYF